MVEAKEVKPAMSVGKLAICLEKRWILRDSPVKQIDCLEVFHFLGRLRVQENFGTRVKIERADIARRRTFDCLFFAWRKFGLQLIGNRLRDLALNGEYIR